MKNKTRKLLRQEGWEIIKKYSQQNIEVSKFIKERQERLGEHLLVLRRIRKDAKCDNTVGGKSE